jgi:DNA-binding NarL/FixJ family response regulator
MSVSKTTVLVAHDEPIVQAGLEHALSLHSELEVRATRETELVSEMDLGSIDIVLADVESGVRLAASGQTRGLRVLIVTNDASELSIRRALDAGVMGYLLVSSTLRSVIQAVECVTRGGTAIDPLVATKMLESLNGEPLTQRQLEVLRLLTLGLPDKAIANRLGIRLGTIKSHVKSVLGKLNATSRTEATRVAMRRGLLPPDSGSRAALSAGGP